jgi:hypothetical protein
MMITAERAGWQNNFRDFGVRTWEFRIVCNWSCFLRSPFFSNAIHSDNFLCFSFGKVLKLPPKEEVDGERKKRVMKMGSICSDINRFYAKLHNLPFQTSELFTYLCRSSWPKLEKTSPARPREGLGSHFGGSREYPLAGTFFSLPRGRAGLVLSLSLANQKKWACASL